MTLMDIEIQTMDGSVSDSGGRFTKGLGALFSVQSITDFPPKLFSETVPWYTY